MRHAMHTIGSKWAESNQRSLLKSVSHISTLFPAINLISSMVFLAPASASTISFPGFRASAPASASNSKLVFQVQPGLRILLCKRASAILWAFPLQRNRLPLLPGIRCSFTHGAHNEVTSHPPFIIYHGNFTNTGRSPPRPWDFRTQHRAVREGILRRALGHGRSDGERVHPDGDGGALWSSKGIQPLKHRYS